MAGTLVRRAAAIPPLVLRRASSAAPAAAASSDPAINREYFELYRSSAQSFYNFPTADIHFRVGEHFLHKGEPHPQIHFRNEETPGILHLSPPGHATFCWFGEKGNLGRKKMFLPNTPVISDPWEADQEISVKVNTQIMKDYIQWLLAIQDKYVEHLSDNANQYKKLRKSKSKDVLRDMATPLVKFLKDENENKVPDSEFISWRQKIYQKSERTGKQRCDLDAQMAAEGGVRRHVPLFTLDGREVPLAQAHIGYNDVISVQNNIMCGLWGIGNMVGINLRRNLRSVTLFEAAQREKAQPFSAAPLIQKSQ